MMLSRSKTIRLFKRFVILLVTMASLIACSSITKTPEEVAGMTGEQVKAYLKDLGGKPLLQGQPKVELERGFDVAPGGKGIAVSYTNRDECRKYCWTQVVRKSLDREIVRTDTYLVTTNESSDEPSSDFTKAVDKWNQ